MQLEVQWFLNALVENSLISVSDGSALNAELGGEPDLMSFAQEFLNRATAGLSPEDAQSWVEQIQQVMQFAQEQAQTGAEPPLAAELTAAAETAANAASVATEAPAEQEPAQAPQKVEPATPEVELEEPILPENVDALLEEMTTLEQADDSHVKRFMKRLLISLREFGASDLHISSNSPLFIRKHLEVQRMKPDFIIHHELAKKLNYSVLTQAQREQFERDQDMNFAIEIHPARFRAALMQHKEGIAGSYRIVPDKIRSLEELGFLEHDAKTIERLLDYHNGLILVTGPLGSGKTTTLAALIEVANQKRQDHIITVEDPIEIVIDSKQCQVTQRQIGRDTESYRTALKGALREDPDIIVIGEMHDLETIENAITAAETGHLVIGTLHTCDAANTLNRLLDVFPPNQQPQIRAMTAGSLRGIVCQKLIKTVSGGLSVCYEILINTLSVSNVISDGKIFQLRASMQIGSKSGMCTIEQNLLELFKENIISYEDAFAGMRDQTAIYQLNQEQAKRVATAGKRRK